MAFFELRDGRRIGDYEKPYIVAEMNSSHNGKIELAEQMIDVAVECGCDAVKFQSWSPDSLYSDGFYKENPMAKRMVQKFSLSEDALFHLAEYCERKGIDFSSTPYSEREVDFLVDKCKAKFIKIASMELNNPLFLKYIGLKGVPVILSTGMGTIEEIKKAVKTLKETGNDRICILHCVSVYPVGFENVNLRNMMLLKDTFPYNPVGYSDHTIGFSVACGASALGAALIEKHFTLDNSRIGWDNQMATEPETMKALVDGCNDVFMSMGKYDRELSELEKNQQIKMRRSLVASRTIKAGELISEEDIYSKRPGTGISPDRYTEIIGKRVNRDLDKDDMFLWEYLDD